MDEFLIVSGEMHGYIRKNDILYSKLSNNNPSSFIRETDSITMEDTDVTELWDRINKSHPIPVLFKDKNGKVIGYTNKKEFIMKMIKV